jgi:hypothetical protein
MSDQPIEQPEEQLVETENGNEPEQPEEEQPWPNQTPVVDGVIPTEEVDQDPDLFEDDDDDPDMEMED